MAEDKSYQINGKVKYSVSEEGSSLQQKDTEVTT